MATHIAIPKSPFSDTAFAGLYYVLLAGLRVIN